MFYIKMASHFKWYPASEESVVPFNARYSFPSQANKAIKITPRISPKSGSIFSAGNIIRVEFPAQGYVHPQNTTLEFDLTLIGYPATTDFGQIWMQNNIQSIFQRVRLMYGSTPLEDIINYGVVVRALTEWTSTDQTSSIDQTSIAEGIGGVVPGLVSVWQAGTPPIYPPTATPQKGLINVRKCYIQGTDDWGSGSTAITGNVVGFGRVPNQVSPNNMTVPVYTTRRYQVNFALGLFTQDKLIPTKFMASQLAIELTLANPASCMISIPMVTGDASTRPAVNPQPSYQLSNVNLIPEILEFDASYDAMFLKGIFILIQVFVKVEYQSSFHLGIHLCLLPPVLKL